MAVNQRLFLGAGPALELGFAAASIGERFEGFEVSKKQRWIERGGPACLPTGVIFEPLAKIGRAANVKLTGAQTEEVNDILRGETSGRDTHFSKR